MFWLDRKLSEKKINCWLPAVLARLFSEKTRGISIALAYCYRPWQKCYRHWCQHAQTLTFCNTSVITEGIYFKLGVCVQYPQTSILPRETIQYAFIFFKIMPLVCRCLGSERIYNLLFGKPFNSLPDDSTVFTLLSAVFWSYHGNSSHYSCLSWVSWVLKCLAQGHSHKKTQRIQCGSNPALLHYESNILPLSHADPLFTRWQNFNQV